MHDLKTTFENSDLCRFKTKLSSLGSSIFPNSRTIISTDRTGLIRRFKMSSEESNKRDLLRHAETILVKTGDTMKRSIIGQTIIEELELNLCCTLEAWIKSDECCVNEITKDVVVYLDQFSEPVSKDERNEYKITVKIFISSRDGKDIVECVNKTMEEMGVSSVECVILSLVPEPREIESFLDDLKPLWSALEDLVDKGFVYTLGVSDFTKDQLEEFYNWAKVKPCINQVNLANCCVIPTEMVDYAKSREIQLFTHSDPSDILPKHILNDVMKNQTSDLDRLFTAGCQWQPSWVSKYSALITCRGVIHSKGYIIKAKRVK